MEPLKAVELAKAILKHAEKHGDQNVLLYDEYKGHYFTIEKNSLVENEDQFAITMKYQES